MIKKSKDLLKKEKNIGMYVEHRIGPYGEYDITLYKKTAQKFIIDNFESLLEFINN